MMVMGLSSHAQDSNNMGISFELMPLTLELVLVEKNWADRHFSTICSKDNWNILLFLT
jgi:hypothetical protein